MDIVNLTLKADEVAHSVESQTSWMFLQNAPHYQVFKDARKALAEEKARQPYIKILVMQNYDFGNQGMFRQVSHQCLESA